jgi:hypothetical protein
MSRRKKILIGSATNCAAPSDIKIDEVWTVVKLNQLKPGERFCFYRGDLDIDILKGKYTPGYATVLNAVKAAVERLVAQRKIDIVKKEKQIDKTWLFEYVAIGKGLVG